MKKADFDQLAASIRQAGAIGRGEMKPSRITEFAPVDVRAIRQRLGKSQSEFALMIGDGVSTLYNWQRVRRVSEGPARALLRVAAKNPVAVAKALEQSSLREASDLLRWLSRRRAWKTAKTLDARPRGWVLPIVIAEQDNESDSRQISQGGQKRGRRNRSTSRCSPTGGSAPARCVCPSNLSCSKGLPCGREELKERNRTGRNSVDLCRVASITPGAASGHV